MLKYNEQATNQLRLITKKAAGEILSVHCDTIQRRIDDGTLKGYTIAGVRGIRVREADVLALAKPIR